MAMIKLEMNEATKRQVEAVIFIDCIRQCNEAGYANKTDYNRALLAMVRNRTGFNKDGQMELAV